MLRFPEIAYIRGMCLKLVLSMRLPRQLLFALAALCVCTSCIRLNSNTGSGDVLTDEEVMPEAVLTDTTSIAAKDSVAPRKRLPTLREQMQRIEEQQEVIQKDIEFIKNDISVLKDEVVQLREAVTTGKPLTVKTDAVKGPVPGESSKQEYPDPAPVTMLLSDEDAAGKDEPKKKPVKPNRQATGQAEKTPPMLIPSDETAQKATAKPAGTPLAEQLVPASETYKEAMTHIAKKNYAQAVPLLETVLKNDKNPVTRGNAYYWLGEAAYAGGEYDKAIDQFKHAFSIKSSTKADDALLMMAESYRKLGNSEEAKKTYNKLMQVYPQSEFVARARKMLQMM